MGDYLLEEHVSVKTWEFRVDMLGDAFDKICWVPSRLVCAPMRILICGICKFKSVAGRGMPEEEMFLPRHAASNPCA